MYRLRFRISMALDGFVAGPDQSVKNPLGIGGVQLHDWVVPLKAWRSMHGLEGGDINDSNRVVEESLANIGATIMGRKMFGGPAGPWDARNPWNGWWGANPPFHHPVFVLTHHPRAPLALEGGTTFTFVTGGIDAALEQARKAAGGRDISLAGGAKTAQQVPCGGSGGRDGDQPRAGAAGRRRAALRRRGREPARTRARAHRRRAERHAPQIYSRRKRRSGGVPASK